MKKLNIYYVVSTIALAFMMLIMARTLEMTGRFDARERKSPAERFWKVCQGKFILENSKIDTSGSDRLVLISQIEDVEEGWLTVTLDTLILLQLKISNFEDEQVLLELFEMDSSGMSKKYEGCELLLAEDESGTWNGSTLGEFCGLSLNAHTYYSLNLQMDDNIHFTIETRKLNDQRMLDKKDYILKRSGRDE